MEYALTRGEAALLLLDEVAPIVAAAFAQSPYNEARSADSPALARFEKQTRQPGFALATAHVGDEVVGVAFGYTLSPTTGWWKSVLEPVDADTFREDGARTFGLFEMAVHPDWQRRGIATGLHRKLLEGRGEERVVLNCRPDATAAQAAYALWGYRRVTSTIPWDGAPVYDVLLLEI
ncbi:GNAT family N-acetyltransferase [Catenulispora yoronensis]